MAVAGLYTDFGGLAQLRVKASSQPAEANRGSNNDRAEATQEVARQFEALLLQTMLKTMRDASQLSESTDSDQTRLYQDMFDKQVALELATRGGGTGLAAMLERDLGAGQGLPADTDTTALVQQQLAKAVSRKRGGTD